MNSNCIFCKFVAGEAQTAKVYEDDETLAFVALQYTNKGQVLVIPKDHVENIYGFSEELAARWMLTIKKMAIAVKNATDADGINLIQNNEEAAGQQVFHAHMHIIPRYNDDGLKGWPGHDYTDSEIDEYQKKIKNELI